MKTGIGSYFSATTIEKRINAEVYANVTGRGWAGFRKKLDVSCLYT